MSLVIHVVAVLVTALPRPSAGALASPRPNCRAILEGERLTTTIEFPNGYVVQGPWRVLSNRTASLENGEVGRVVAAVLDHIIEIDAATGQRSTTPFPEPVETTFEGESEEAVVESAAQVWCMTVIRVKRESGAPPGGGRPPAAPTRLSCRIQEAARRGWLAGWLQACWWIRPPVAAGLATGPAARDRVRWRGWLFPDPRRLGGHRRGGPPFLNLIGVP